MSKKTIEHPKDDAWEQFIDEFVENFSIIGSTEYKIFICGSYGDECFSILEEVKKEIIKRSIGFHLTFFESDFEKTFEENFLLKFDLLADFSDEIIMVIEHETGEQMIETGIIIGKTKYKNKTCIFVLKDASITQILTPFFIENENLIYFNDINDLKSKILEHLE